MLPFLVSAGKAAAENFDDLPPRHLSLGEARRFLENVVVAFQFNLSHTNPCPFATSIFIRNRPEPSARQLPGHYFRETISVAHCAVLTRGFHHHPDDRLGAGGANQDSAIVA